MKKLDEKLMCEICESSDIASIFYVRKIKNENCVNYGKIVQMEYPGPKLGRMCGSRSVKPSGNFAIGS